MKLDESEMSAASIGVPLKVNPGKHQIVASTSSDEKRTVVELAEGESKSIELEVAGAVAPPPSTKPKPPTSTSETKTSTLVWIGGAIALVGVGAGAATGVLAFSTKSDVSSRCTGGTQCNAEEDPNISRGMLYGNISTVSFIVASVGVGVLVYGLLNPSKVEQTASRPRWIATPFGVAGTF